jgi:hypothetical protein
LPIKEETVARRYFVILLAVGTLLGVLNVRRSGTTARAQENNPELPTVTQPSAAKGTDQATVLALKDGQPPLEGPWGLKKAVVLNASLPRVLLIGDSIVGGYGKRVALRLKGKANVDIWETPQWLNAALDSEVQDILKSNHYDVIHFNESGLHAWAPGRVPEGQYGPLMLKYLATLQKSAPQTNVIDDLYAVMVTKLTLAAGDRFHWNNEGFDLLAETVTNALLPLLENKGQIRSSAPPK